MVCSNTTLDQAKLANFSLTGPQLERMCSPIGQVIVIGFTKLNSSHFFPDFSFSILLFSAPLFFQTGMNNGERFCVWSWRSVLGLDGSALRSRWARLSFEEQLAWGILLPYGSSSGSGSHTTDMEVWTGPSCLNLKLTWTRLGRMCHPCHSSHGKGFNRIKFNFLCFFLLH